MTKNHLRQNRDTINTGRISVYYNFCRFLQNELWELKVGVFISKFFIFDLGLFCTFLPGPFTPRYLNRFTGYYFKINGMIKIIP